MEARRAFGLYNYYAVPPGEIAAAFEYPKSASLAEKVVLEMASAVATFGKKDQDEFARAARAFKDFYGIDTPTVRNVYKQEPPKSSDRAGSGTYP